MSVQYAASSTLQTEFGLFGLHCFEDIDTKEQHLALSMGCFQKSDSVLTRIHSECLTGDSFFSVRCDCGAQLKEAMKRISEEKKGIILYLRQEGRGIGLLNKIRAYHLQDHGNDTIEANEKLGFAADMRTYEMCSAMLRWFGIEKLRLMTNNPRKVHALFEQGINVEERLSLITKNSPYNKKYLEVKRKKLGHMIPPLKKEQVMVEECQYRLRKNTE